MPVRGKHIGTLIKAHGYKGEMVLKGSREGIESIEEGSVLFIEIDGQRIPFFIESFFPDVSGEKGIIAFEFITSDTQARRYIACQVFNELSSEDDQLLSDQVKNYVGYTVVDKISGKEFMVKDFFEQESNPILILDSGKEELMIPVNADYFQNAKAKGNKLFIEFPDGLLPDDFDFTS